MTDMTVTEPEVIAMEWEATEVEARV